MKPDKADLQRFFERHKERFEKCLEPTMVCQGKAIRAHSIQNARVLDLIAVDGHLIALRPRFSPQGPDIDFQRIGRNHATTFTGLCGAHDRALFLPLDTKPFDETDREQLFLLAYRSVTRELHAVMEGAVKIQGAYLSGVERGIYPADIPSPAGILATEHLLKSYETFSYRAKLFDAPLLKRQFGAIEHHVIILTGQRPCVAVSSLFSLDGVLKRDDIVRVVLNVFPLDEARTAAVFSYTPEDRPLAVAALDRITSTNGAYQKFELSKLILSRMENFVISPAHFESWSADRCKIIKTAFIGTIIGNANVQEHPDLMLF